MLSLRGAGTDGVTLTSLNNAVTVHAGNGTLLLQANGETGSATLTIHQ